MTEQTEPACPAEYEWIKPGVVTWHFSGNEEAYAGTVEEPPFYNPEFAGHEDEDGDVWDGWMYTREDSMAEYCCSAARATKPPAPPNELTTLRATVEALSAENQALNAEIDKRDQWVLEACEERNELLQKIADVAEVLEQLDNPDFLAEALQNWIVNSDHACESHWEINSDIQAMQIKKALAILNEQEAEGGK